MTDIQLIQQFSSGRLDNAIQVTQFIDATISSPVTPQKIRNVLKESGLTLQQRKNSVCKEDPQVEEVRVCTLS